VLEVRHARPLSPRNRPFSARLPRRYHPWPLRLVHRSPRSVARDEM